jgi:hypothetical protein
LAQTGRTAGSLRNERGLGAELICPRFLLFSEANLQVYYAPFHHLKP